MHIKLKFIWMNVLPFPFCLSARATGLRMPTSKLSKEMQHMNCNRHTDYGQTATQRQRKRAPALTLNHRGHYWWSLVWNLILFAQFIFIESIRGMLKFCKQFIFECILKMNQQQQCNKPAIQTATDVSFCRNSAHLGMISAMTHHA